MCSYIFNAGLLLNAFNAVSSVWFHIPDFDVIFCFASLLGPAASGNPAGWTAWCRRRAACSRAAAGACSPTWAAAGSPPRGGAGNPPAAAGSRWTAAGGCLVWRLASPSPLTCNCQSNRGEGSDGGRTSLTASRRYLAARSDGGSLCVLVCADKHETRKFLRAAQKMFPDEKQVLSGAAAEARTKRRWRLWNHVVLGKILNESLSRRNWCK